MLRFLLMLALSAGNEAWEVQDDPGLLQVRAELKSQFEVKNGGVPDCAWDTDDEACPPFALGRFTIGLLGVNACPAGTIVVTEATACAEAAFLTDFPFSEHRGTEGDCYWAGQGAQKNKFKMHDWAHADKAKWVCEWDQQQKQIDSCQSDDLYTAVADVKECSESYNPVYVMNGGGGTLRLGLMMNCDSSINWYFDEPVVVGRFQIYTGQAHDKFFLSGGEISYLDMDNNIMAPTGLKMVSPYSKITWEGNKFIDENDPQLAERSDKPGALRALDPDAGRYTAEFDPVRVKGMIFKSTMDRCEVLGAKKAAI